MEESILLSTINQRLERKDLILPTLPDVALEANEVLKREDVSTSEVVKIIKKDPAIAASVIRYANSVIFADMGKISSIERATIRIGLNHIRNIILSSAIEQIFFAKDISFGILISSTWKKSSQAAICAGATINTLHNIGIATHVERDSIFLAALVHNIGTLPILTEADRLGSQLNESLNNIKTIKKIISSENSHMTRKVLGSWGFNYEIIDTATRWSDCEYEPDGVNMIDVLRLAMINTNIPTPETKEGLIEILTEKGLIDGEPIINNKDFSSHVEQISNFFN